MLKGSTFAFLSRKRLEIERILKRRNYETEAHLDPYRKVIMTLRTYRYFYCPNGHKGEEITSENDQLYSSQWDSTKMDGISAVGKDVRGYATYECSVCGAPMFEKILALGKPSFASENKNGTT